MRVLVFGDSIAQGFFDTVEGGWVNQLWKKAQINALNDLHATWDDVFNLGVDGDTAEGVLARLEAEVEARRLFAEDECIVIAVGINDSLLRDNLVACEVYDFQATYEQIIDKALEITPRVVCVGLSAVKESMTDPWPYAPNGEQFKNNRINLFEDTIKQSAELKEVAFVPIYDQFFKQSRKRNLLADGLHPNHEGHMLIAAKVAEAIEVLR